MNRTRVIGVDELGIFTRRILAIAPLAHQTGASDANGLRSNLERQRRT